MKRLCICITILTIILAVTVYAESIDLSSLTMDELLSLQENIAIEINNRNGDSSKTTLTPWYDYGLGQYLPDPSGVFDHEVQSSYIRANTDSVFMEKLEGSTREDLEAYEAALIEFGYNEHVEYYGAGFSAIRDQKYKVTIIYADFRDDPNKNYMTISMDIVA